MQTPRSRPRPTESESQHRREGGECKLAMPFLTLGDPDAELSLRPGANPKSIPDGSAEQDGDRQRAEKSSTPSPAASELAVANRQAPKGGVHFRPELPKL